MSSKQNCMCMHVLIYTYAWWWLTKRHYKTIDMSTHKHNDVWNRHYISEYYVRFNNIRRCSSDGKEIPELQKFQYLFVAASYSTQRSKSMFPGGRLRVLSQNFSLFYTNPTAVYFHLFLIALTIFWLSA